MSPTCRPHFEKTPFKPEKKPGGVTYRLNWLIKDPVFITIQRKVKGKWRDLETDTSLTEIVAGERMVLRGVATPDAKTISKSAWFIDDNNGENYIKAFDANEKYGKVVQVGPDDLDDKQVDFVWHKGSQGKVRCEATVDGETYDKEITFSIEKPAYTVTWENSDSSHFGECVSGNQELLKKWPLRNRNTSHGYSGDLAPGKKVYGLEYNGILFTCSSDANIPGKTQLGSASEGNQTLHDFTTWNAPSIKQGLDHKYPTAYNDSFYDAPAIPTSVTKDKDVQSWRVVMAFDLYLMFRPDGRTKSETEQNEWVPVTLVKWSWEGEVRRDSPEGAWYETASKEPVQAQGREPTQEITDTYPKWDANSADF